MGRSRVASAIGLAMLMALSTVGAPATAQATAQDPKQPSVDNPHMHFWGTSDLSNCWTHFDSNDSSGSANEGYGESSVSSGRHTVDFDCRMQDTFKQDMYLDNNGSIQLEFTVEVYAPGACPTGAQNDCEELNVTIMQGTKVVAKEQFNGVDGGDPDSRIWQIDVDQNMTRWNRSAEEPILNFRWIGYADSGLQCIVFLCESYFRFYYSDSNESAEMNFPVVNMTQPGEGGGDDDEGGLIGGVSDSLPGFGLMAGVGSLALAAVAASRLSREE